MTHRTPLKVRQGGEEFFSAGAFFNILFKILLTQVCSAYCAIKLLFETFFTVSCTLGVMREKVGVPFGFEVYKPTKLRSNR